MVQLTLSPDFPVYVYYAGEARGVLPDGRHWSYWSTDHSPHGRQPIAHLPVSSLLLTEELV